MTTVITDKDQPSATPSRAPGRRRLGSLPTHARTTSDQAASRSRLVKRLRIALPACALALVAAFVFNTRSDETDSAFLDDFQNIEASAEELSMANPRFAGIDNKGKPFEITASTARQNTKVKDVVTLDRPRAVQGQKEGETKGSTIVSADNGVYRSDTNILELTEDVTLEHEVAGDTYIFRSPAATVAIKDEVVTSDAGVGGSGPKGRELNAERMKAYNGDGRVVFEGNVHMRIYPKKTAETPTLKDVEIETPQ